MTLAPADLTTMDARLMGLSKVRRKDGDWFEIRIQVHPDDMPTAMYGVPLGTRLGLTVVQIADDEQKQPVKPTAKEGQIRGGKEQLRRPNASKAGANHPGPYKDTDTGRWIYPTKPRTPFHDLPRYEQKRKICGIPAFQDYMHSLYGTIPWHEKANRYNVTDSWVKQHCGIDSGA